MAKHRYPFSDHAENFGLSSPKEAIDALETIYKKASRLFEKVMENKDMPPLYEKELDAFYSYLDAETLHYNFKVKTAYQKDRDMFRYLGEDKVYRYTMKNLPVKVSAQMGKITIEFPLPVVSKHSLKAKPSDYTYAHFVDAALNIYERENNVSLSDYLQNPLKYTVCRIYKKKLNNLPDVGNIELDLTVNAVCSYLNRCDNSIFIRKRTDEVLIRPDEAERTLMVFENYSTGD